MPAATYSSHHDQQAILTFGCHCSQGRTLYQPAAGLFPQFSSLYVSLWFFLIILGLGGPTGAQSRPHSVIPRQSHLPELQRQNPNIQVHCRLG